MRGNIWKQGDTFFSFPTAYTFRGKIWIQGVETYLKDKVDWQGPFFSNLHVSKNSLEYGTLYLVNEECLDNA